MFLKLGTTRFFTASISATTSCSFNFASMQLTSGTIRVKIAIHFPFQCYAYMVLAPALLAEGLFHYREGLWQRVASTTAKFSARNFEK